MRPLATTDPESDPAVQRQLEEARARQANVLLGRERRVELLISGGFLASAVAMAVFLPGGRDVDPVLAIALVIAYAVAGRVEFHTGGGWTMPTQLVFVPMLFLLPTSAVPLFVAAGILLGAAPEYLTGKVNPARAVFDVGDAWHAVGPALVLSLAGADDPAWSDWPLYLAALGAQFAFDFSRGVIRGIVTWHEGVRTLAREASSIYLVDALLAPIGLLAAFASAQEQWAFLLVMPLVGLIGIFAREREARIDNALELGHAYRGTAHLLTDMLTADHEYTGSHSRSVIELAREVGNALDLDEVGLRDLEFAALLHDIGKVSVPNEIINKPGPLNDEEWEIMRRHTIEGERMLKQVGGVLAEAGSIVRSHHEHYDGNGYPDGLIGDEIPVAARIISCCDAFNAMTTDRAYRQAMPQSAAVEELRVNSGTQFDPAVVEALLAIVADGDSAGNGAGPTPEPAVDLVPQL
jgi:HD-GYP domain-containing protein (c-di-GMP phosphodiesterase class II)